MADGNLGVWLRGSPWTGPEMKALREAYLRGGLPEARKALPHRSDSALRGRANQMGLRSPVANTHPDRQRLAEQVDEALRALYSRGIQWGDLRTLCETHQVNRAYVARRVQHLGLPVVQLKGKPWSKAERELLHETAHMTVQRAAGRFRMGGFKRTPGAIQQERSRQSLRVRTEADAVGLRSTTQLGELLGVVDQTVRSWITLGLKAERRGSAASCTYLVRDADLRKFIAAHPLRVHLNRIPGHARTWFVTMLSGLDVRAAE